MKTVNSVFIELWTLRSSNSPYDKATEKRLWMLLQNFLESKGSRQAPVEDYKVQYDCTEDKSRRQDTTRQIWYGIIDDLRRQEGGGTWAVMFDDESLANEHLRSYGQPELQGKPFPIVPALEPDAFRIIP